MDRKLAGEPAITTGERHPVLKGFDETDILPFGGVLEPLRVDRRRRRFWPRSFRRFRSLRRKRPGCANRARTFPGLILNEAAGRGRVAFLPADLDRRFGRDNLPDHGNLLANLVRWAARDNLPLQVEGAGFCGLPSLSAAGQARAASRQPDQRRHLARAGG